MTSEIHPQNYLKEHKNTFLKHNKKQKHSLLCFKFLYRQSDRILCKSYLFVNCNEYQFYVYLSMSNSNQFE